MEGNTSHWRTLPDLLAILFGFTILDIRPANMKRSSLSEQATASRGLCFVSYFIAYSGEGADSP